MKFVLYTVAVSPHQMPLARVLVKRLGPDEFRYVYTNILEDRAKLGWGIEMAPWIVRHCVSKLEEDEHVEQTSGRMLEECDVLLSGVRDIALFKRRNLRGLKTFYMSERWFKPPKGMFRLADPRYMLMALKMRCLIKSRAVTYLPIGVHAEYDMRKIVGSSSRIEMKQWGYFVEPSEKSEIELLSLRARQRREINDGRPVRILWAGRFLDWKRVDTLIDAARRCGPMVELSLYGLGPEEVSLKKMSRSARNVFFHGPVSIGEVRELMRTHDLYVLPSNGYEGWGAVVNEAMSEKMPVIGTHEAGASRTLLPDSCRFSSGDVDGLVESIRQFISNELPDVELTFTPESAAHALIEGGDLR